MLEAQLPGDLDGIDTFYVGHLQGVVRAWPYTAPDVASSHSYCWLSDGNDSHRAAEFADLLVVHYRDLGVSLQRWRRSREDAQTCSLKVPTS